MKKLFSLAVLGGLGWFVYTLTIAARRRGFDRLSSKLRSLALLDLNHCSREDLLVIDGVTEDMVDRIIDRRPYRSKFDLTNQLVLSKIEYDILGRHITVDTPRDASILTPDAESIA